MQQALQVIAFYLCNSDMEVLTTQPDSFVACFFESVNVAQVIVLLHKNIKEIAYLPVHKISH